MKIINTLNSFKLTAAIAGAILFAASTRAGGIVTYAPGPFLTSIDADQSSVAPGGTVHMTATDGSGGAPAEMYAEVIDGNPSGKYVSGTLGTITWYTVDGYFQTSNGPASSVTGSSATWIAPSTEGPCFVTMRVTDTGRGGVIINDPVSKTIPMGVQQGGGGAGHSASSPFGAAGIYVPGDPGKVYNGSVPCGPHSVVNTFDGNVTTTIPIISWPVPGGLSVDLEYYHQTKPSSSPQYNAKFLPAAAWCNNYDSYLIIFDGTRCVTCPGLTSDPPDWGEAVPSPVYTDTGSYPPGAMVPDGPDSDPVSWTEVHWGNGGVERWMEDDMPEPGNHSTVTYKPDIVGQKVLVTTKDNITYTFRTWGAVQQQAIPGPVTNYVYYSYYYLTSIADRNGNTITITRDTTAGYNKYLPVKQIDDGVRELVISPFNATTHIQTVGGPMPMSGTPDTTTRTWIFDYSNGLNITLPPVQEADPPVWRTYTISYSAGGADQLGNRIYRYVDEHNAEWDYHINPSAICPSCSGGRLEQVVAPGTNGTNITQFGYAISEDAKPVLFAHQAPLIPTTKITTITDPNGHQSMYTWRTWRQNNNYRDQWLTTIAHVADTNRTDYTRFKLDAGYDVTQITGPTWNGVAPVWKYTYKPGGGDYWQYGVENHLPDPAGNVMTASYPPIAPATQGHTLSYTYNGLNQVLTVTDPTDSNPNRVYLKNTYDYPETLIGNQGPGTGNLLTTKDALAVENNYISQTYNYNTHGQVTDVTDAMGNRTEYKYNDAWGNLTNVVTMMVPNAPTDHTKDITSVIVSDELGRKLTETTGLGPGYVDTDGSSLTAQYTLDEWGRSLAVTTAGVLVSHTVYDGRPVFTGVTSMTTAYDGNGHWTKTKTDAAERVASVEKQRDGAVPALSDTVSYVYDGPGYDASSQKGLLSSVTDGNGRVTYFGYDALYNKATAVYGLGTPTRSTESWVHDPYGNLIQHTDGNGSTIQYTYDLANRLTVIHYPTGSDTWFNYDGTGRRYHMHDATGETWWSYYDNDLPVGADTTQAINPAYVNYSYDHANRRTYIWLNMLSLGSSYNHYVYDGANRLTSEDDYFAAAAAYQYYNSGATKTVTNANGTGTTYGYNDALHRLKEITHTGPGGTLAHYTYTYDAASNVTDRSEDGGPQMHYTYDYANQLLRETNNATTDYTAYTYDHNGNRLTKEMKRGSTTTTDAYTYYPGSDRLKTAGAARYEYDGKALNADGSLTSTAEGAYSGQGNCTSVTYGTGSPILMGYDYEDRVTGISCAGTPSMNASFIYNGLDLRVQKTDQSGPNGTAKTYTYVCDGSEPASPVLADGTAIYTPGIAERRGTTSSYYHDDALGSTRLMTGNTGSVSDAFNFDAFGSTLSRTGTTPTPFGFVGKQGYQTDGSSLMLLGHRYYDPSIGRFISQDPAQDENNWYSYCGNDPLGMTDPSGLVPMWQIQDAEVNAACLSQAFLNPVGAYMVRREYYADTYIASNGSRAFKPDSLPSKALQTAVAAAKSLCAVVFNAAAQATMMLGGTHQQYPNDYSTSKTDNKYYKYKSEGQARIEGMKKLGKDPVKIAEGKWRSQDGTWQFRAKRGDIADGHVHLEKLNPKTGEVLQNNHLGW